MSITKDEIIKNYQVIISEILNGSDSLTDLDKIQLTFALAKDDTYPMDEIRRCNILEFINQVQEFQIDDNAILWKN